MPKYLVFMDIDGTLLTDHQYVSERTRATIERFQKQDVLFYIATGACTSWRRSFETK